MKVPCARGSSFFMRLLNLGTGWSPSGNSFEGAEATYRPSTLLAEEVRESAGEFAYRGDTSTFVTGLIFNNKILKKTFT